MTHKIERMSSELKKEISLILRNKLANPNVSPFSTVSDIILSKDIKYATVFIIVSDLKDEKKTIDALNSSAGFIRRELASTMSELRTIPALHFKPDSSENYGRKIDSILNKITYGDSE